MYSVHCKYCKRGDRKCENDNNWKFTNAKLKVSISKMIFKTQYSIYFHMIFVF